MNIEIVPGLSFGLYVTEFPPFKAMWEHLDSLLLDKQADKG